MSKKMKVLVSVLAAILLLTMGGTAMVMAQEEPDEEPTPPTLETEARCFLARVADILDIDEEDLVNAFEQARQEQADEIREWWEQRPTDEIEEWWEQKPEIIGPHMIKRALRFRAFGSSAMRRSHTWGSFGGRFCMGLPEPAD